MLDIAHRVRKKPTTRAAGFTEQSRRSAGAPTLALAWTTTRATGGEHLFAPAVMTDPAAPRSQRPGGRERLLFIDLC
jgi:hypothetical protein